MKTIPLASSQFGCAEGYADSKPRTQPKAELLDPTASLNGWYLPLKAVLDCIAAGVLLVLALPVILICAIAVMVTSRGPAFYCQRRVGKGGREFTLIKLRTMHINAESRTGPVWSVGRDPRVTRVGRFLRETHLDELPQLINVLIGQMSLVGPRPERPTFVSRLRQEIPLYQDRVKLRPGITGLSQMRLPPDSDLESVRRKLVCDLYYVKHVSPWLDVLILGYTAAELVQSLGSSVCAIFRLPAPEVVERDFYFLVQQDDDQELNLYEADEEDDLLEDTPERFSGQCLAEFTTDRAQAPI